MSPTTIYADHAATTSLSRAAYSAMLPWLEERFANPSALYSPARESRLAVKAARACIAAAIGAEPSQIIFTGGGSESDNLAIKGVALVDPDRNRRFVTDAIEHHAILHAFDALKRYGYSTRVLPVDERGIVHPASLSDALAPKTALVSIMLANNEIGTIEPIRALADAAHAAGALFHTDAVQAVGHIPVDVEALGVDMLSASAHKFNGPKGAGFLYVRRGVALEPLIHGGGQEGGLRGGTENVAGIVGMAAALQEHIEHMEAEAEHLRSLQQTLTGALYDMGLDLRINGSDDRIPGNVSLSFAGADGEMLLHRLDLMGVCVATGSACNSRQTEVSHVIRAIHCPPKYARGTLRISFGPENTPQEALKIAHCIAKILSHGKGGDV